eukprot:GHVU01013296.1.p1 GENE.GHVU01013296.1~~GHVU01013296.1.p1  ORF type:complete len:537 (+),score=99.20 GHVU01013296.1:642-2252(+)
MAADASETDEMSRETILEQWNVKFSDSIFLRARLQRLADPALGWGVVARARIEEGQQILKEMPLAAMQTEFSKRCTPACASCFKIVGTAADHVRHILTNESAASRAAAGASANSSSSGIDDELHNTVLRASSSSWLAVAEPSSATTPPPPPTTTTSLRVTCPGVCGEVYCGPACRENGMRQGRHLVLCTLHSPGVRQEYSRLETLARRHHENLLLVFAVLAAILRGSWDRTARASASMAEFTCFYSKPWESFCESEVEAAAAQRWISAATEVMRNIFREALSVFSGLAAADGSSSARDDEDDHRQQQLLSVQNHTSDIDAVCQAALVSQLLGQFRLVNVDVEFDNCALNRRAMEACLLAEQTTADRLAVVEVLARVKHVAACRSLSLRTPLADMDEAEWMPLIADPFPPFIGTGLFRGCSTFNHSCFPNAEVDFKDSAEINVFALRAIDADEEIRTSYVDESKPLNVRRRELKEFYGFDCGCEKCRVEAAVLLLRRRGAVIAEDGGDGTRALVARATGMSEPLVAAVLRTLLNQCV